MTPMLRSHVFTAAAAVVACGAPAFAQPAPAPRPAPVVAPAPPQPPQPPQGPQGAVRVRVRGDDADELYDAARNFIERGQLDRAMAQLNAIIERFGQQSAEAAKENRVDAAMYWKAYTEAKMRALPEALATVAELQKTFADSRWVKDAMSLAIEVRQATGQAVSTDQPDEELKLLALRGLMQSDPDRAVPMIEQLLAGNSSVKVKENALFVLSQSRAPRSREILASVAKSGTNPDLQLKAIRYLGALGGSENAQLLDEVYRGSSDERVKRAVLRSFMVKGDRVRLASIANDTSGPVALRGEAIQQLGILKAESELTQLYGRETNTELKRRVISGLYVSGSAGALVTLARAERDPGLKRDIVQKLSVMKSKEASDYMVELLK